MKRFLSLSFLIFTFVHLCGAQTASKLANVRKIFVGDLGRQDGSDLVKEKIRVLLMKSERFTVVEKPGDADATLTGVAGVERSFDRGSTDYAGIGVLRLVDSNTSETLWVFEYKRGLCWRCSVSSRVADKTVEQLLKDAKPSEEKKKK